MTGQRMSNIQSINRGFKWVFTVTFGLKSLCLRQNSLVCICTMLGEGGGVCLCLSLCGCSCSGGGDLYATEPFEEKRVYEGFVGSSTMCPLNQSYTHYSLASTCAYTVYSESIQPPFTF